MKDHSGLTTAIEHYRRGIEFWNEQRTGEAVASFERALEMDPQIASLPYEEGLLRAQCGDFTDAEGWLWIAHLFRPEHVPTLNCLGDVLRRLCRVEEALPLLERAVSLAPESWEAHSDLSLALRDLDRLEDAADEIDTAVRLRGLNASLASNLASIRKGQGRLEEALRLVDEALRLQPELQAAHVNRAHILLLQGRFEEGWREYERRPQKLLPQDRVLRDRRLNGKSVLIHQEQGLGDLIQFVRYADRLLEAGARVTVSCDEKLIPLIQSARGVADAVSWTGPGPALAPDYEVNIMSLPCLLGECRVDLPYFEIDRRLVAKWRERLGKDKRLRVGIVWGGNPANPVERTRGIPLKQWEPILSDPNVAFYSLQLGAQRAELSALPRELQVADLQEESSGILDVAAAMINLDLVITTDTMPAHLAGALGTPVWVLLSFAPDWRWMLEREDSPWYPSARLFRQASRGDWEPVIRRVVEALKGLAAGVAVFV